MILHGGKHDLNAFMLERDVFANSELVDTLREYSYLQGERTPGLKTLASTILSMQIKGKLHSPV